MARTPTLPTRILLAIVSVAIAATVAEAALRVLYRDAGRRTLGGPGGYRFEHEKTAGELRGRLDFGPKKPGVPRIMVVGDSITYGVGVRDWRDTWPELLIRKLERSRGDHELAVFAMAGANIREHLQVVREWSAEIAPDVFIYQWYVNDIEAISHRPDATRAWQRWRWHDTLRSMSYLYFVLDHRLWQWLPPPERSYVDYLLTDFVPGTIQWAEFERMFHELALRASNASRRRIMTLYPQVPFRGRYPLQSIHDRMHVLASPHNLHIPPAAWMRSGGTIVGSETAPWRYVFEIAPHTGTAIIETAEYVFSPGPLAVVLSARRLPEEGDSGDTVAILEVVDMATNDVIGEAAVDVSAPPGVLRSVPLSFSIAGNNVVGVRFRVRSTGGAGWGLADLAVPVDYGFEVVDLTEPLRTFNSHASSFDAHPNEAAHRVIAEHVYAAIVEPSTPPAVPP